MATQATAVRKVLNTAAGLGMGNQKTYDDYTSQCNLLATHDPPVPNPFPSYFRKAMHGVGANVAHSASDFWASLADAGQAAGVGGDIPSAWQGSIAIAKVGVEMRQLAILVAPCRGVAICPRDSGPHGGVDSRVEQPRVGCVQGLEDVPLRPRAH